MSIRQRARWIAVGLLLAFSLSAQTPQRGVIEGLVLEAGGAPLKGAKIRAVLSGMPMAMVVPSVTTDVNGSFSIDSLRYGTYYVSAEKERDDYPDATFSFYSDTSPQSVAISSQHPVQNVILLLGPKAAVIYGVVRDTQTGKPVPPAFEMSRTDHPRRSLQSSVGSRFRILIPASTDVSIEVSSPGYQKWIYINPQIRLPRLSLSQGQEMNLDVFLHPSPSNGRTTRFLVPDGYKGWLTLKCQQGATLTQLDERTFKFPDGGHANTASTCPTLGPQNEYFYLSSDGSLQPISSNYWTGQGKVWGEHQSWRAGVVSEFGFFVGTENEYANVSSH